MFNGECLRFAPLGYYIDKTSNSKGTEIKIFKKCQAGCKACINEQLCSACNGGARLVSGKCYDPCQDELVLKIDINF